MSPCNTLLIALAAVLATAAVTRSLLLSLGEEDFELVGGLPHIIDHSDCAFELII